MRKAIRRPAAVGALVALVLVGAWWKLLWQPQGAAIAKAHKQTTAASTNLYAVEQTVGHLRHLQLISPKLTALEQKLSAAVPATDDVDQFLLTLNALTQQTDVTVGSITLSPPTAVPGSLSTIGAHFTVTGDYFAVQGFLDALRATSRIIVIDSLAEGPAQKSAGSKASGVSASLATHLLSGLAAPVPVVQKLLTPPTTAAPTGIISGPVTKAKNAVASANANTATINNQANAIGSP
jgi:Tfp pilus assembly protein PilO